MRKLSNIFAAILLLFTVTVPATSASAADYKVIHNFCSEGAPCPNGFAGFYVTRDAAGNIYGLADGGASYAYTGLIWELSPKPTPGKWAYRVLYRFCSKHDCNDSFMPSTALTIDKAGNLYGATCGNGGVIYRLSPNADRSAWSYRVLKRFDFQSGEQPYGELSYAGKDAGLLYDGVSPLYGETELWPSNGTNGSIFQLTPVAGTQAWKYETVHHFCVTDCLDGENPGSLTVDASGNLYGVAKGGGAYGVGLVFRLSPKPNGGWKETIVHTFCSEANCADGQNPSSSLVMDPSGNLIGTVGPSNTGCVAGAPGCSFIYRLSPDGHETIVYKTCQTTSCPEGASAGSLVSDGTGNIYGTTGTAVFVLRKEKTLKTFNCAAQNCGQPNTPLIIYNPTTLIGTGGRGLYGQGSVFEITHNPLPQ